MPTPRSLESALSTGGPGVTRVVSRDKQSPEQFEGGANDTLTTAIVGGATEATGLTATLTLANEEPLEIKAKTRAK